MLRRHMILKVEPLDRSPEPAHRPPRLCVFEFDKQTVRDLQRCGETVYAYQRDAHPFLKKAREIASAHCPALPTDEVWVPDAAEGERFRAFLADETKDQFVFRPGVVPSFDEADVHLEHRRTLISGSFVEFQFGSVDQAECLAGRAGSESFMDLDRLADGRDATHDEVAAASS